MGIVTDEQSEKRQGQFLKLEDKSIVVLYSNLFKTQTHFLQDKKTSVICKGEGCYFCQTNKKRMNYFYYGKVNNEEGVMQMPASVFYAINEQERVLGINKRDSQWVISKKGSGLDTEYGVARGKDAEKSPVLIKDANEKLAKICDLFVKNNEQRYTELSTQKIMETEDIPAELKGKESDDIPF
jgi:hypothetical protein